MRKTERELKRRKQALPKDKLKVDPTLNGDADLLVEQHKEVERKLFPLRLSKNTVIYVTKDKQNEAYAERARRRMDITEPKKPFVALFHRRTLQRCTRRTAYLPVEWPKY